MCVYVCMCGLGGHSVFMKQPICWKTYLTQTKHLGFRCLLVDSRQDFRARSKWQSGEGSGEKYVP